MIVWITGLSGAGKTTLCSALRDLLKPRLPELVILDGDIVRAAFGHNLGYSETDRILQVGRLQAMSKVLAEQGLVVIVAVLYGNADLLDWNRTNLDDYFEVYLHASLDTVIARDTKALYAQARDGKMGNVVGMDIEWHEPVNPDMVLDADNRRSPVEMAREVAMAVPRLRVALPDFTVEAGGE